MRMEKEATLGGTCLNVGWIPSKVCRLVCLCDGVWGGEGRRVSESFSVPFLSRVRTIQASLAVHI